MKNIKTLIVSIALTAALPLSAAQTVFVPGNDSIETKICISAAENNLFKYKRQNRHLSSQRSVYSTVANNLKCNDENVASFASRFGADKTVSFISRYIDYKITIRRELSLLKSSENNLLADKNDIIYVTVN